MDCCHGFLCLFGCLFACWLPVVQTQVDPNYTVPILSSQNFGCFKDNPACPETDPTCRVLNVGCRVMSPQVHEIVQCMYYCRTLNGGEYLFAGKTSFGFCCCGVTATTYGLTVTSSCTQNCRDDPVYGSDPKILCGGPGVMSIYRTCPVGYFGDKCERHCHCQYNLQTPTERIPCTPAGQCLSVSACADGWTNPNKVPGFECDYHDCSKLNGQCREMCILDPRTDHFDCKCLPGFDILDGDDGVCADVDECHLNPTSNCTSPPCRNLLGTYTCGCDRGFQHPDGPNGGLFCVDIDECVNDTFCNSNISVCQNSVGSYTCTCKPGYQVLSAGSPCRDIDECLFGTTVMCDSCINRIGTFTCSCNPGRVVVQQLGITKCVDFDECSDAVTYCGVHSLQCQNTESSFTCLCQSGYKFNTSQGCQDIDECSLTSPDGNSVNGLCGSHAASCTNTDGSFSCNCNAGYRFDNRTCEDIDECAQGEMAFDCTVNGICDGYFPAGDFTCVCKVGYVKKTVPKVSCELDVPGPIVCPSTCPGGYKCVQDPATSAKSCADIDECATPALVSAQACHQCVNTDGGYTCTCNVGYHIVKTIFCRDVDECASGNAGFACTLVGKCINTVGSFRCTCNVGYQPATGDTQCVDVDECATMTVGAQQCTNTVGSFQCATNYYVQLTPPACLSCQPSSIQVKGGGTLSTPAQFRRSASFELSIRYISPCPNIPVKTFPHTLDYIAETVIAGPIVPVSLGSTNPLIVPPRTLGIAIFKITGKVLYTAGGTVENTTFVEILPSPLIAVIEGGSSVEVDMSATITVSAVNSVDPDWPDDPLTYTWWCSKNANGVQNPTPTSAAGSCKDKVLLDFTEKRFTLVVKDLKNMQIGDTLYFRLDVSNPKYPSRSAATFFQTVAVVSEPGLNIKTICLSDCESEMNPSYRLVLMAHCLVCQNFSFRWDFVNPPAGNKVQQFSVSDTLLGMQNAVLNVNPRVFESDAAAETYEFELTVFSNNVLYMKNKYRFTTNPIPHGGTCNVTPLFGFALTSTFNISCTNFVDDDLPLSYQFSVDDCFDPEAKQESVLYKGSDSFLTNAVLPQGPVETDYTVCVRVYVIDSLLANKLVIFRVKVEPVSFSATDYSQFNTQIGNLVDSAELVAASQLITAVATALNSPSTNNVMTRPAETQMRMKLLQQVAGISGSSPSSGQSPLADVLQRSISALKAVTADTDNVDASQVIKTVDYNKLVQNVETSVAGITTAVKNDFYIKSLSVLLSSVSNVMVASDNNRNQTDRSITKEVSDTALKSLDSVNDILLQGTYLLEKKNIETPAFAITVSKFEPLATSPTTFTQTKSGIASTVYVHPAVFQQFIGIGASDIVDAKMVTFEKNPYAYADEASSLNTHAVKFGLLYQGPVNESNYLSGVGVALATGQKLTQDKFTQVELTPDNSTAIITIQRQQPDSAVLVYIHVGKMSEADYAQFDKIRPLSPTDLNARAKRSVCFDRRGCRSSKLHKTYRQSKQRGHRSRSKRQVPTDIPSFQQRPIVFTGFVNVTLYHGTPTGAVVDLMSGNVDKFAPLWFYDFSDQVALPFNRLGLSPSSLSSNSNVLVIETKYDESDNYEIQPVTLGVMSSETYLKRWDPNTNQWTSDGCQIDVTQSSVEQTVGRSSTVSTFAGGSFVRQNPINFSDALKGFLEPWENPVGIGLVAAIFILFFLLLIWALWKDRQDALLVLPIDLADNVDNARYVYFVTVFTGSRLGAGTTSTVYITLYGKLGTSATHRLTCSLFPVLQRGQINIFIIRTVASLGDIKAIRMWHYNLGKSPKWLVSRVVVHDWPASKKYFFLCDSWLAADYGAGTIDRTFTAATTKQAVSVHNLLIINSLSGIHDKHLWFSVATRPTVSPFTRAQRLACCLCLVLGYLFTNIMLYGIEPSAVEDKFKVGPVGLSWEKVAIGIESAIIMLPVSLLLATLFRSSRPRPTEVKLIKDLEVYDDLNRKEIPKPKLNSASFQSLTDSSLEHLGSGSTSSFDSGELRDSTDDETATTATDSNNTDTIFATPTTEPPQNNKNQSATQQQASPTASATDANTTASGSSGSSNSKKDSSDAFSTAIESDRGLIKASLPWWTVYLAWILVIVASSLFAFFTILYTFGFGKQKGVDWCLSVLFSFTIGVLIEQPLKVIVVSIVLAFICRKSTEIDIIPTDSVADQSVRDLNNENLRRWRLVHDIRSHPHYKPPHAEDIVTQDDVVYRRTDLCAMLVEILQYLLFIVLILAMVNTRHDYNVFLRNHSLSEKLFENTMYKTIETRDDFWFWVYDVWLDVVFGESYNYFYQTKSTSAIVFAPARLLRFVVRYSLPYEFPYSFNMTSEADIPILLRYDKAYALLLARSLYRLNYLNINNGLCALELLMYTPYSDLVTLLVVIAELPTTGGFYMSHAIHSFRLHQYVNALQFFNLAVEIIFTIFTIIFLIYVIQRMVMFGKAFFYGFWNWIDLAFVAASVLLIVIYITFNVVLLVTSDDLFAMPYSQLFQLDTMLTAANAFVILLAFIKFLRVFHLLPVIDRMMAVFKKAAQFLVAFLFYAVLLWLAIAMFLWALLGHSLAEFISYRSSLATVLYTLVRATHYDEMHELTPFWGPFVLLFLIFFFIVFVHAMSIAIVMTSYVVVQKLPRNDEDREFFGHLGVRIKTALGFSSVAAAEKRRVRNDAKVDNPV